MSSDPSTASETVQASQASKFSIRPARDADAWDLIGVVAGCWSEYPGCVLDVHGEVPELLAIATHYANLGGRFWVAEQNGRLVASIGICPSPLPGRVLLTKLYVARSARRQGLAALLVERVEASAAEMGASEIELWSDTRFHDAHRLYERLGYQRADATRELHDLSASVEYQFVKSLPTSSEPLRAR